MELTKTQFCPICERPYKGRIGVGVHLKGSHTSDERVQLHIDQMFEALPLLIIIIMLAVGICEWKERLVGSHKQDC